MTKRSKQGTPPIVVGIDPVLEDEVLKDEVLEDEVLEDEVLEDEVLEDEVTFDQVSELELEDIAKKYGSAFDRTTSGTSTATTVKSDYYIAPNRVRYFKSCRGGSIPYGKHKAIVSRLSKLGSGKSFYLTLIRNLGGTVSLDWAKKTAQYEVSLLPSSPAILRVINRQGQLLALTRAKDTDLRQFAGELYLTMMQFLN